MYWNYRGGLRLVVCYFLKLLRRDVAKRIVDFNGGCGGIMAIFVQHGKYVERGRGIYYISYCRVVVVS